MFQSFKYLFIALFLVACQSQAPEDTTHSAYYWTTTFQLSQQKSDFIRDHHIRHLYVRFFDVVSDEQGGALPNATITFADAVPTDLEIIPTVFIMNDCLTHPADSLAQHVSSRILKMCRTHDIPNVREIQIDCDWTARTQQAYFQLLADMRQLLKPDSIELSSTIRLHQLATAPPPVSRATLMIYNTGDPTDRNCLNPIFAPEDIKPYLRHIKSYPLPLSQAYPIFSWDRLFRADRFIGIQHFEGEYPVIPGDTIITSRAATSDILEIKQLLNQCINHSLHEIILFDLSEPNNSAYPSSDISAIYQ